jgi:hypothetical protein
MFGGGIGAAEEKLGGAEEQAGGKLAQVAVQMQDDINTRNLQSVLFNQVGPAIDKKYAAYLSLKGQAAHEGYDPFIKDVQDTIDAGAKQIGGGIATQNAYMQNARFLRQRIETSASVHAATELDRSYIETNTAANKNITDQSVFMQNDGVLLAKNALQVRAHAEMNALRLNKTTEEAQADVSAELGKYWSQIIQAKMLAPEAQGGGAQAALTLYNSVRGQLDANSADAIARMLHPAVKDAEGDAALGQSMRGLGYTEGGTTWTGPPVSADQMDKALWSQESGGAATARTSVTGATGGHQIQPATFQQYAKPGERIDDPTDNAIVGARIAADYTKRYDGDPARVAVAYFSGPDNVAPAGSPTPWKQDLKDPTGKSTSSYVGDVLRRVGGGGEGQAAPSGWHMPDWSKLEQDVLNRTAGDPELRTITLSKLAQTRSRIEMATATERTNLEKQFGDLSKAAEAGVQITIPEDRIRAVFPPDVADRYIATLGVSQAAGTILSGLKYASPEQLGEAVTDLTTGSGTISDTIRARLGKATGGTVTTAEPGQPGVTEPAELFGMRTQIAARAIQLIQARQEQLRQDPASYTLGEPTVAAAAKVMDPKNPASFDQYARTQLAIQEHLGVRPEAQHVLTKAQADTFTQQVMQPGGDAKATLDGLEKQWGDAWTHVFGDMVTLGKLPAEYQGVVALDDPKMAAVLARAAGEQQKSGKAWDDIFPKPVGGRPVAAEIRDDVRGADGMKQLEASWRGSGATLAQVESMRSAVETLAYGLKYYNNDAAPGTHAVEAFTSKFRFIANGGARVPADKYDAVMGNAGQMLTNLSPTTIAVPPEFRTEETPEARRLNPTAPAASDYIANLQANPTWITSPKADALWLLDSGGRVVRDPKGNPVAVPFNAAGPAPAAAPTAAQAGPGTT